ncbi:MFS transporter [Marinobacterium nitratireducens]|uniref:MFS transporter n=1 Tax=Marinobacterium nitratireducens TaxID=518897 RepID=A0A917Z764_9GAMM|nr:MFS transporter [Marinobacterium nitratireducens]GGO76609.1 MFS transporter [Marinobacterium nitratireducens]
MNASPLQDRRYRHLFSAQVISLFGTGLTTVALALLAHQIAGGRAGEVLGIALALKMVAYVFVAPLIGSYARQLPRRTLLVSLDLLRAAAVLTLPFITTVWQIYCLVFLLNLFSAGFTPVFQATIPDIIRDRQQYDRALSLSRLAYDLENLLSPTIAAMLIAVISFDALFVFNAIAFVASAVLVVSVVLPGPSPDQESTFWHRAKKGMTIYLRTPRLQGLLALCLAVAAVGSMQIVNTVVYVRTYLGLDDTWVAIALAAAGGGSMSAALLIPRALQKVSERPLMLVGGAVMAAGVMLGTLQPDIAGLMVLWFLIGFGSSLVQTPVGRLLIRSCHEPDRPAVFAAQFSLSHACWLLAYPLAGWIGANVGQIPAFGVMGAIALVSVLAALALWPAREPDTLEHAHEALDHRHLHYHDEHHQHEHEGWEGPEPHSHPHRHAPVKHRHRLVIDEHHPHWPVRER